MAKVLISTVALLALMAMSGLVHAQDAWIGGSSAAAPLVNSLLGSQSSIPKKYASSKSQDGVDGVKSGKFYIGVSTIPFSAAEESGFKKLTVPQAVLTLSAFTSAKNGIKLTGTQIAKIFLGQITTWQQIPGSGLTGIIKPIVRSDAAGVTQIYTSYLRAAAPALWPLSFVGEGPFQFGNPNTVYAQGAGGVAAATASTGSSLGFTQTGTGKIQYKLKEVAIQNKAGRFVLLTGRPQATYESALPRSPPASTASWSGVKLVFVPGASTFPVVSLVYFFYRPSYPRSVGASVKAFGVFAQSNRAQNLAQSYFFYRLPTKFTVQGTKAIKSIRLT